VLPDPRASVDAVAEAHRQIEVLRGDGSPADDLEGLADVGPQTRRPLDRKLGPNGEHLPLVGPLGHAWTVETLTAFVSGLLFGRGLRAGTAISGGNWQLGPNAMMTCCSRSNCLMRVSAACVRSSFTV
jgi:hypothetical protein